MTRRFILLLVLVLMATLMASNARAALPPQGVYDECVRVDGCWQDLNQIGAAGFKLVLPYTVWSEAPVQLYAYAKHAEAAGVKIIWPLNGPAWRYGDLRGAYPLMAEGCASCDDGKLLTYMINFVKRLPATWGFYIGDELPASEQSRVAFLSAVVRKLAPHRPQLYVGYGASTLAPFAGPADVLGADIYPVGTGAPPAATVRSVAQQDAQIARATGDKPAMVLQSFAWSQYFGGPEVWPTYRQMRAMRNAALSSHPSMILWYSFFDINRSSNPAKHWFDLVAAALH